MFYNQDILTIDFLDYQLMSEGKTADNPIECDFDNGWSSLLSNYDKSLFPEDNPQNEDKANTQSNDDQDDDYHIEENMTMGLQQDRIDSSTSNDEACRDPSEDDSDEAGRNSSQAQIVEVRVSIISAPIKLNHTIHLNFSVFVFSL